MTVRCLETKRSAMAVMRMPLLLLFVIFLSVNAVAHGNDRLDLSGEWRFELDGTDTGVEDAWFNRRLSDQIRLPGSLQQQGFGSSPSLDTQWTGDIVDRSFFESPRYEPYRVPDNFKVPFWLQPRKHFVGPAWYQRDFTISRRLGRQEDCPTA